MFAEICANLGVTSTKAASLDTIYDDLLFDGAFHIVFGEQQTGKTYFVLDTVVKMLDELGEDAPEVWYFDGDLVGKTIKFFSDKLNANPLFQYREVDRPDFLEKLVNGLEDAKFIPDTIKPVVIFDSLKDFTNGKSIDLNNELMDWWGIMKRLRPFCSAIIIIHHSTVKSGERGIYTKIQGNENALTQTAHMIFEVTDAGVTVFKSKCGELQKGDVVLERSDQPLPYYKYYGKSKNQMFTALGYFRDDAIKERIVSDENSLWKVVKRGRKLVVVGA